VIAAITSCTNTSNPSVMVGAGILARNAVARGLHSKPWVKTSLAPGSKVVTEYLDRAGLTEPLEQLGFNLVGYGCTTCIGNSGPLSEEISRAVADGDSGSQPPYERRAPRLDAAQAGQGLVVAIGVAVAVHEDHLFGIGGHQRAHALEERVEAVRPPARREEGGRLHTEREVI
jgi:hypothetical protein